MLDTEEMYVFMILVLQNGLNMSRQKHSDIIKMTHLFPKTCYLKITIYLQ